MNINISPMVGADVDSVVELLSSDPNVAYQSWECQLIRRAAAIPRTGHFVAERNGEIVGVINSGVAGPFACINHLYVKAEFRGGHVSKRLMAKAEDAARSFGAKYSYLIVIAGNDSAKASFAKMGYRDDHGALTLECDFPLSELDSMEPKGFRLEALTQRLRPAVLPYIATQAYSWLPECVQCSFNELRKQSVVALTQAPAATETGNVVGVALLGACGIRGLLHVPRFAAHYPEELERSTVVRSLQALEVRGVHRVHLMLSPDEADRQSFFEKIGFEEKSGEVTYIKALE